MISYDTLILVFLSVAIMFISLLIYIVKQPQVKPSVLPPVSDPALPEIRERAVERLICLPHFRSIRDGSLFDYRSGASLRTCTCEALPYPHLILKYGQQQGIVFETAGALDQYVSVQEATGRLLTGRLAPSSTGEGC